MCIEAIRSYSFQLILSTISFQIMNYSFRQTNINYDQNWLLLPFYMRFRVTKFSTFTLLYTHILETNDKILELFGKPE